MTRLYALIVAIFIALTLPAFAQDQQAPNYDAWNKVADQTEQILESNQANEARLQAIGRLKLPMGRTRPRMGHLRGEH